MVRANISRLLPDEQDGNNENEDARAAGGTGTTTRSTRTAWRTWTATCGGATRCRTSSRSRSWSRSRFLDVKEMVDGPSKNIGSKVRAEVVWRSSLESETHNANHPITTKLDDVHYIKKAVILFWC